MAPRQRSWECRQLLAIGLGVLRIDGHEPAGQLRGHIANVLRQELHMRIPLRVHVPGSAVDDGRRIQQSDMLAGYQVTGLTMLEGCTRSKLQENREPTVLQACPGAEQHIRPAHVFDETGAHPDVVRVLTAMRSRVDADRIAPDFRGHGRPLGFAGKNPHLGNGRGWFDHHQHGQRGEPDRPRKLFQQHCSVPTSTHGGIRSNTRDGLQVHVGVSFYVRQGIPG